MGSCGVTFSQYTLGHTGIGSISRIGLWEPSMSTIGVLSSM